MTDQRSRWTRLLAAALGFGVPACDSAPDPAAGPRASSSPGTAAIAAQPASPSTVTREEPTVSTAKINLSEEEWQKKLTPEQYYVCRQKGTERAFTGKYWNAKQKGSYNCVACGHPLFSSETKFDSGTGWPSFWQPIAPGHVATEDDSSFFMRRTEVLCARCDAHLGHVFDDGPAPTGKRYCINSVSLELVEESGAAGDKSGK